MWALVNCNMSAMALLVSALALPTKPCRAPGKCVRSIRPPAR